MSFEPINTEYNGYKFRSRLEARWAIFLDELQIPYAYEPEGFDLNDVWYLPDFHLSNVLILHKIELPEPSEIWVEVKHSPDLMDEERQKIAEFVKRTDYHILLIGGQPDLNVPLRLIDHHPEKGWFVSDVRWIELPNREIGLVPIEKLNDSQLLAQTDTPRLRQAIKKARQARFEHNAKESKVRTRVKCESCGKIFFPKESHYYLCYSCYNKRNKSTSADSKQNLKRVKSAKKKQENWKRLLPISMLVGILFLIGIAIFTTIQLGNNLFSPFLPIETATVTLEPTKTSTPTSTPFPTNTPSPTPICTCNRSTYDCSDFETQSEAQACFDLCFPNFGDVHFLDNNEDRIACESLP